MLSQGQQSGAGAVSSLWTESGPQLVFVKKLYWNAATFISCIILWHIWSRGYTPAKVHLFCGSLWKKLIDPYLIWPVVFFRDNCVESVNHIGMLQRAGCPPLTWATPLSAATLLHGKYFCETLPFQHFARKGCLCFPFGMQWFLISESRNDEMGLLSSPFYCHIVSSAVEVLIMWLFSWTFLSSMFFSPPPPSSFFTLFSPLSCCLFTLEDASPVKLNEYSLPSKGVVHAAILLASIFSPSPERLSERPQISMCTHTRQTHACTRAPLVQGSQSHFFTDKDAVPVCSESSLLESPWWPTPSVSLGQGPS